MIEVDEEEFIILNTNYVDKSSQLVVELILVQTSANKQKICTAGYAVLPIFEFAGASSAMVLSGTPRQVSSGDAQRSD